MTRPRSELIDLNSTSYYHCISRCVRRAFLWGEDHLTNKNYSHRKTWVVDRLAELSQIFSIDVCAYAVMSNHYHVVLHVDSEKAKDWSNQEVVHRWKKLFSLPILIKHYQEGITSSAKTKEAEKIIQEWRNRLINISWFMRSLNEYLARKANEEDNCSGRFWEGRFKSQALLDDAAVLMCMSYVDLNPVRAGIADSPDSSDFTSIQERIDTYRRVKININKPDVPLLPFAKDTKNHRHHLNFTLEDYFELIDWAGRIVRNNKSGFISNETPSILQQFSLNPENYINSLTSKRKKLSLPVALGSPQKIKQFVISTKRNFMRNFNSFCPIYC